MVVRIHIVADPSRLPESKPYRMGSNERGLQTLAVSIVLLMRKLVLPSKPAPRMLALGALLFATIAGCGSDPGLKPTDADQKGLASVLESWKKGETLEELKKAKPPISVSDPDWSAGKKLVGYRFLEERKGKNPARRIPIELEIKGDTGKATKKTVRYAVSITPTLTVVREVF